MEDNLNLPLLSVFPSVHLHICFPPFVPLAVKAYLKAFHLEAGIPLCLALYTMPEDLMFLYQDIFFLLV